MVGQIRRGWIWRFWGAPIFRPEAPKPFKNRYLGTSGLKIGVPQKRQILPRRIWPPICGPLTKKSMKTNHCAYTYMLRTRLPLARVFRWNISRAPAPHFIRSLGNGVHKNGVRNRCPYRRCGVDTEIPYRLPVWREFCWVFASPCGSRGRYWISVSGPYRR